jgi:dipeptidase E
MPPKAVKTRTIRKIVAAGRGRVIQSPVIRDTIKRLSGKANPHVVYLGTASYDQDSAYELQAAGFTEIGCTVERLNLVGMKKKSSGSQIKSSIEKADIIAVSGGNTLFAMKQWRRLGVDTLLRNASENGVVLCGGSAGAICWFDGGHSDSRDPTTLLHVDPKFVILNSSYSIHIA